MTDWKSKIILKQGETLKHVSSSMKGFMQETDVTLYDVIDIEGAKSGSVKVEDHTAVKGFKRTISVLQKDNEGNTVTSSSWKD